MIRLPGSTSTVAPINTFDLFVILSNCPNLISFPILVKSWYYFTVIKMKAIICVCLVGMVAVVLARPNDDKYTDKYDNVDLDEVLENDRLREPYLKCVVDKGKCAPDAKELKSKILNFFLLNLFLTRIGAKGFIEKKYLSTFYILKRGTGLSVFFNLSKHTEVLFHRATHITKKIYASILVTRHID